MSDDVAQTHTASASPLRWLHEGARTLLLMKPRWDRLAAGPALLAFLWLASNLAMIGVTRLFMDAGAVFHWRSALAGWAAFMLIAWACYVLRPAPTSSNNPAAAPGGAYLLALIMALGFWLQLLSLLAYAGLGHIVSMTQAPLWVQWAPFVVSLTWAWIAMVTLMLRAGDRHIGRRLIAVGAFALSCVLNIYVVPQPAFWTEAKPDQAKQEDPAPVFTQEVFEAQAPLLAQQIDALKPQRPGVIDMYTITFAPYEGEEVFRRESRVVNEVMSKRFDAAGRGLKLINHAEEIDRLPWATPLNLQRAIEGIAQTMDLEEDVLFIHLTSHGASDGELAANFWPLDVDPVTPPDLRRWLDEAGIKHRVISISACFAGNWIAPLASDDTLVMTASDADHTSYGCGKKSELTFFGRAMYDELLRIQTLSFEKAHASARLIIDKREKEAGKDDGYSNPQIKVGAKIRPYLEKMQARLKG